MANSEDFRVLACDGGGIRGLITTVILERLEQKLGSPLNNYFDMFAGTSTGSIIACCIAKGMPVADIRKFYEEKGKDIFPNLGSINFLWNSLLERIKIGDYSLPLFPSDGLEKVLQDTNVFGKELFGTLPPTLVVAYDAYNRTTVVFKSNQPEFAQIPIWEICRSSSAAPTAFAGHILTDPTYIESLRQNPDHSIIKNPVTIKIPPETNGVPLIDGGVVANNPSLCAIAECIHLKKSSKPVSLENICVVSFGTGQMEDRITANDTKTWGILDWLNIKRGIPLLEVYADGSADLIDYIATQLLRDKYNRYQPLVPNSKEKPISTFQADPQNLANLVDVANDFLDRSEGDCQLEKLAAYLSA